MLRAMSVSLYPSGLHLSVLALNTLSGSASSESLQLITNSHTNGTAEDRPL